MEFFEIFLWEGIFKALEFFFITNMPVFANKCLISLHDFWNFL